MEHGFKERFNNFDKCGIVLSIQEKKGTSQRMPTEIIKLVLLSKKGF